MLKSALFCMKHGQNVDNWSISRDTYVILAEKM